MSDHGRRMFFVLGSPRSGTTLLMRMLNVHADIYTRPEPHLMTPLASLGYYQRVDKASYDPFQAAQAVQSYVADLPRGEEDYLDALRAYCDIMYGRMLDQHGKRYFVDKTPANSLEARFIAKVYPEAVFVVLTRHPFAIFSSYAKSFFDDDWVAAHDFNPIIERYVPALADFIRDPGVERFHHVRYEELVTDPEGQMRAICEAAELEYDPSMIDYGQKKLDGAGLGDPIGVGQHSRPTTASIHKWARNVKGNEDRMELLRAMAARVPEEDLAVFGYTHASLWDALEEVSDEAARKAQSQAKKWDRYRVERRALVALRKRADQGPLAQLMRKLHFMLSVVLRGSF